MTYQPLVHDLDLCVLSYQVYNQTLRWPLDPWYERWSRLGSSRRDNMIAAVHDLVTGRADLRGPGSTRTGWPSNPRLDPIVTDYSALRPVRPCFTQDGVAYRLFATPKAITERIREAVVCEYGEAPRLADIPDSGAPFLGATVVNPDAVEGAADRLHAFEGGTGGIEGNPPAWGLAGIVLERDLGDGRYAVHVAFRGSQSGSAYRAAYEGFVEEGGNPDWVTDTEVFKMVADSRFSTRGLMVRGFRDATASALGTLLACLAAIDARRGRAPDQIRVTGHSLGGALATQFVAAMTTGTLRGVVPGDVASWPWDATALTTFGAPKVGDDEFARSFDRTVDAQRIWAGNDPLVAFPTNAHVGAPIELATGLSGTVNHEPSVIRRHLLSWLADAGDDIDDVPRRRRDEPWRAFATLAATLEAAAESGWSPGDLVSDRFDVATDEFVELAGRVIASVVLVPVPAHQDAAGPGPPPGFARPGVPGRHVVDPRARAPHGRRRRHPTGLRRRGPPPTAPHHAGGREQRVDGRRPARRAGAGPGTRRDVRRRLDRRRPDQRGVTGGRRQDQDARAHETPPLPHRQRGVRRPVPSSAHAVEWHATDRAGM